MIFKRRERPGLSNRLREFLYPRKGFWRGMEYLGKRIRRLPDSPHRIALGFACGALASFTPFFGFHFVVAVALAWMLRANLLASAFGTAVGNPITFPFIAAMSLQTGWWILGSQPLDADFSFGWLTAHLDDIFVPYVVGGIGPGILCAVVCYAVLGPIVAAYQARRRIVIERRATKRRTDADREQRAYAISDAGEGDNA